MKISEFPASVFRFLIPVKAISRASREVREFSLEWFRTRQWRKLISASIPAIVGLLLAWSLLAPQWPGRRQAVIEDYRTAAQTAADAGDVAAYRLNFRRMLEMSGGGTQLRFDYASTLFRLGKEDEALRMMSGLAPSRGGGYEPAHRFLAEHIPAGQSRQMDLLRAVHLGHVIRQNSEARPERLKLVNLLAGYRSYERAEKTLRPTLDRYPEDSLTIARLKARSGNIEAARMDAYHACEILRPIVANEPENLTRRIQLAQGYIFLAKSGQALDVLAEALPESPETPVDRQLIDAMSRTFEVWLSLMPERQRTVQRICLSRLAALPESAKPGNLAESTSQNHDAVAGKDAVFFASVLESPRRSTVINFLRGSIAAADGNLPAAEERLRLALNHAVDDPSIRNNLAWTLLQRLNVINDDAARAAYIEEALSLSTEAVKFASDIAEFRETYAQILAATGQHAMAVDAWKQCLAQGLNNRRIQKSLAASLNALGKTQEAMQHELESRDATF